MNRPSAGMGSIFGGALLVAGTCIGGGMLGLPVSTAAGGFYPAVILYCLCWLFMGSTANLMGEVCLWAGEDSNIVTMAQKSLGFAGKIICWVLYLFLFYSLTVAYVTGCGDLVTDVVNNEMPEWIGTVIFVLLFGPFVWAGAKVVDRLNALLMLGLGATFALFVGLGVSEVEPGRLMRGDWGLAMVGLPVAFVSFAFQGLVPTLTQYMGRDGKRLSRVIWIGSFLPVIAYGVWEALILGAVPYEMLAGANNAVAPLKEVLSSPTVVLIGEFFAFFAMTTSFLGVTLGLLDFLSDGLGIEKTAKGRSVLCALIFVPPVLVSWTYPHIFLLALGYAGGLGCALLLGVIPILMVWNLRYRMREKTEQLVPGGKPLLLALLAFVLLDLWILLAK